MVLGVSILVIFIISFVWALFNLSHELARPRELRKIKESLSKEKILYKKS